MLEFSKCRGMGAQAPAVGVLTLLLGCGPGGYIIPDRVSCESCEIQIEAEIKVGAVDGPGSLLGRPTHVIVDSLDRVWVSMLDYGFPYVYDRDGQFLGQVGHPGSGPGEFQRAWVVAALPGDSVLLEAFPSYLVVGPDLTVDRVIRGSTASLTGHRIVSWPREVVVSKLTFARGTMTAQVLSLDLSADLIGEGNPLLKVTGADPSIQRRAEPVPSAGTWVSEVTRYALRLYAPDGIAVDSLERQSDWFPASHGYGFGGPNQAPASGITALRSDSLGRLWVYIDRAAPNWGGAWQGISLPQGRGEVRVSSLPPGYELWRTTVEVIDPRRRRVLARKDLDGHAFAVLGPDRIATFVELESGIPVVTIHRLTLLER